MSICSIVVFVLGNFCVFISKDLFLNWDGCNLEAGTMTQL